MSTLANEYKSSIAPALMTKFGYKSVMQIPKLDKVVINVASGEALVRQFLVGKKFFKEEFGVDNKIMWLPDVFGYSGAIPQLIKKCGMEYFMTTKISWYMNGRGGITKRKCNWKP